MLTAVKATYENGQIIWHEQPPVQKKTEVVVTFLDENANEKQPDPILTGGAVRLGSLKGKLIIPDDFNDPLDDLNEYMH